MNFVKSYFLKCIASIIPTMSLPEAIFKSNSEIARNLTSALKDCVLDEDEDDYYVSHILCKRAEDSIQAILDNTSAILKLVKKPVLDSDKLQSPDPVTFSHSVKVVDTIFVEAEPLVCEPIVIGTAIFCNQEVAGGVFVSPSVYVLNDSHCAVSQGLSIVGSHSFCLPDGKANEKVGKSPLYSGIVIYFHVLVLAVVTVTIGRPTVFFMLGQWPNAIT